MSKFITIDPTYLEAAEKVKKNHQETRNAAKLRKAELSKAEDARDELRAKLTSGDESVTASELAKADAERERCELLLKGADRRKTVAERSTFPLDMGLAELVAELVQSETLYDVPVTVTHKRPEGKHDKRTLPRLFAVLDREPHQTGGGLLSGKLDLLLYSPSRMLTSPPADEISKRLRKVGFRVDVNRENPAHVGEGVYLHAVSLDIERGWATVPTLHGEAAKRFVGGGATLASALAESVRHHLQHYAVKVVQTIPVQTRKAIVTEGDTVTETLALGLCVATAGQAGDQLASKAAGFALAELDNLLIPGKGRVASVTVTDHNVTGQELKPTAEDSLWNNVGHGFAEVTLTYRAEPAPELDELEGFGNLSGDDLAMLASLGLEA